MALLLVRNMGSFTCPKYDVVSRVFIRSGISLHCPVAWPSGLRRWFKAPVSSEAWVRIPPLPTILGPFFIFLENILVSPAKHMWTETISRSGGLLSGDCIQKQRYVSYVHARRNIWKNSLYHMLIPVIWHRQDSNWSSCNIQQEAQASVSSAWSLADRTS